MRIQYNTANIPIFVKEDKADDFIFDLIQLVSLKNRLSITGARGEYHSMTEMKKEAETTIFNFKTEWKDYLPKE